MGIVGRHRGNRCSRVLGIQNRAAKIGSKGDKALSSKHFPELIRSLPEFDGPFDAHRLNATNCEVLFASYPAGTAIDPHTHPTENCGVITEGELILIIGDQESRYGPGDWYHLLPNQQHAARFKVSTSEIEFWFDAGASAEE